MIFVDTEKHRVVVEKINMIKRHTRPNPQKNIKGGIVEREASIDASNVMIVSPDSGQRSRIGVKILDDGRRVRVAKVDGAILDR